MSSDNLAARSGRQITTERANRRRHHESYFIDLLAATTWRLVQTLQNRPAVRRRAADLVRTRDEQPTSTKLVVHALGQSDPRLRAHCLHIPRQEYYDTCSKRPAKRATTGLLAIQSGRALQVRSKAPTLRCNDWLSAVALPPRPSARSPTADEARAMRPIHWTAIFGDRPTRSQRMACCS